MNKLRVLTEEQARAIHADRRSYARIAADFGISIMTVSHIKSGKTWKHLGLQPCTRAKTSHKTIEQFMKENPKVYTINDGFGPSPSTEVTINE